MLLALDTSTGIASVALFAGVTGGEEGPGLLAEHTWRSGQRHTTQLLPLVEELLAQVGARAADLRAVGVALGPGSFNGLRVGLATAKLLAFGLGVPLVGVNTLEATAYQHREVGAPVRPIYDAGRGQIATALYLPVGGALREVEPPRLAELADVAGPLAERTVFCGELLPGWREEIRRRGGALAEVVSAAGAARRAGYLAELAWQCWQSGEVADAATLQPLYLRRPPVLERAPARLESA